MQFWYFPRQVVLLWLLSMYVMLTVPLLDYETGGTGDFSSIMILLEKRVIAFFYAKKIHYTKFYTLYTVHSKKYIIHYTLFTMLYTLYTQH